MRRDEPHPDEPNRYAASSEDSTSVRVRAADPLDAESIASILEEVGVTKLLAEPDPLTRKRLRDAISAADDVHHTVLVAVSRDAVAADAVAADQVIGFIAVHWTHNFRQGVDGFVSDLFVRSDHRGSGGGTALLNAVKRRAATLGCQRLVLFNGKNSEAYERGFYPKLGFSEHDELACFMLELPPEGFPS